MARANFVKKARKDYPESNIKKGESYYWWKFRFGGKYKSKTPPRRSQLTQSGFLSGLCDLEDGMSERLSGIGHEEISGVVEELTSEIECLRDECQDSLDNMPEHLQESSDSGMLLQERIDALEDWISNLENIEVEVNEEEIQEQATEEIREENEDEPKDIQELIQNRLGELIGEKVEEIIAEIEDTNPGIA